MSIQHCTKCDAPTGRCMEDALWGTFDEGPLCEICWAWFEDCTCHAKPPGPTDIDPPEVKRNPNCPVHGRDPDYERDRQRDDKATGDA